MLGVAQMTEHTQEVEQSEEMADKKKQKKKNMKLLLLSLATILGISGYAGYTMLQNAKAYEINKLIEEHPEKVVQMAENIDTVDFDTELRPSSTEKETWAVMNKMCHQKIYAKEKWGAIPMIPSTINQVYQVVEKSQYDSKSELLLILEKWKKGDFTTIDYDHDYILRLQDGNVGHAIRVLTPEEEADFIVKNFNNQLN